MGSAVNGGTRTTLSGRFSIPELRSLRSVEPSPGSLTWFDPFVAVDPDALHALLDLAEAALDAWDHIAHGEADAPAVILEADLGRFSFGEDGGR